MTRLHKLLVLLTFAMVSLTSCEDDLSGIYQELGISKTEYISITSSQFSSDHKHLYVNIKELEDIYPYVINDTNSIRIKAALAHPNVISNVFRKKCSLESISEVGREETDSLGISMLVLVDLTLPQDIVNRQYYAVREIRNMFSPDHLYLTFMTGFGISKSMPATDYVMANAFKHIEGGNKLLYRSILEKCNEVTSPDSIFDKFPYHVILVFSDGVVYHGDDPIDADHFNIQEQLIAKSHELGSDNHTNLFYVSFKSEKAADNEADEAPADAPDDDDDDDNETTNPNLLKLICKDSQGWYADRFNWPMLKQEIFRRFNVDIADFKLSVLIADKTVFKGSNNEFKLRFYDAKNDSLITDASTTVRGGSIFKFIIVNGASTTIIILQGIVWIILLSILIYLCFQYLIPYIRYRIFHKKYVHVYTGNQMMFNNHPVGDKCYYCKSPFVEGDEIVVKCEHVMHKDCWDENGYHCPEYGRHCKEGSHYYNQERLSDPLNSSYYMYWILLSVLAATMAWVTFLTIGSYLESFLIESIFQSLYNITPEDKNYQEQLSIFGSNFQQLPAFGLWISFYTTFFLSMLTVFMRKPLGYLSDCLIRAVVAGIGGWLSFAFVAAVTFIMHLSDESFLLTWMPWPLVGCIIALCVTWHTSVRFRMWWILVSLVLGLISMALWEAIVVNSIVDYRDTLLISHLVFALGLGISIASKAERSERFFLHVDGAIKPMDIAIYKWFRNNIEGHVSIGKSVDCQLQMSWDINSPIAPIQAEISGKGYRFYLTAVEEGVFINDTPMAPGERVAIYHGSRFRIGNTYFTYLEKDM